MVKKTKVAAKSKTKKDATKKTKSTVKKSSAKNAVPKKIKAPAKKVTAKKTSKSSIARPLRTTGKKTVSSAKIKSISPAVKRSHIPAKNAIEEKTTTLPETQMHNEDLHFIPEPQSETHPVTTLEAHQAENKIHHKEEVAFHQENQKAKDAMSSKKNLGRLNRSGKGRR